MLNLKILIMTIFIFIFVAKNESATEFDQEIDDIDLNSMDFSDYEAISKWPSCSITYKIVKYSSVLSARTIEEVMANAFSQWSNVSGLKIERTTRKANIRISFFVGDHGDGIECKTTSAHAAAPPFGFIHINDEGVWGKFIKPENHLLEIALQEIGHALGYDQSSDVDSIMYIPNEFTDYDRSVIKELYGDCYENQLNEIDESACPPEYIDAILQTDENDTFIFKDRHYWELNKDSFTVKPGSYKLISQTWPELNEYVDAAFSFNNLTHFIKGNLLYLYNGSDLLLTYPKDKNKVYPNFKQWWIRNFKIDYLDATYEWEYARRWIPFEDIDKAHAPSILEADAVLRQANKILFFHDQHYYISEIENDNSINNVSGPHPISTIWPDCNSKSSSLH